MNSIASLNKKWWYRLLKVIFCVSFLVLAAATALLVYTGNRVVFKNDAQITCNYGNHEVFYANRDKSISLNGFDPNASQLPNGLNVQLMQACAITDADVKQAQADSATATAELVANEHCDQLNSGFAKIYCGGHIVKNTYTINPDSVPSNDSGRAILYVALDIVALCLAFELIRRTFYYIFLGKLNPPRLS